MTGRSGAGGARPGKGARPHIDDAARRARVVARHHLGRTAEDPVHVARAVVAVHSSDPITPHLAMRARVPGFATADLDGALLEARTLWRMHAMRRTLFVVPAGEAPVFHAAAARDVARRERKRMEGWLAEEMPARRVRGWLATVEERVVEVLSGGAELRTVELAAAVPELATEVTLGSGRWSTRAPLSSRLLFVLAMEGRLVRTRAAGSWRSSQYLWAEAGAWFDEPLDPMDEAAGRATLVRRYLASHGPATALDVRWWTGWTARRTAEALRAVGAVPVRLDSGGEGFVLPDDVETAEPAADHVALLPGLDPTPMGWKERNWYLGGLQDPLFDRNGNVGPTVWIDGGIAGGWGQRPTGEVVFRLLGRASAADTRRMETEAARLTGWLAGTVVTPRFRTPLERALSD